MISQSRNAADILESIRRVTIILNPTSGRGQGAKRHDEVEHLLHRSIRNVFDVVSWRVVETTGRGSATALAAEAAQQGVHMVVAAGGDGTVSEVLNGLVGTETRLGILPLGTGNDFARTLGIGTDLKLAVLTLFYGNPRKVDVGRVHGRYFLNVAGCGFDAVCAQRVNQGYRYLHGTAAYLAAVYQSLLSYKRSEITLTVDGETRKLKAMLCSVANAQTYGGGMRIAPDARLNDGLLDVCIVTTESKWEFLKAFPRVFRGTHVTHPDVILLRGREIRVESDPVLPVLVDGEVLGTTPADFSILPQAITVMTPEIPTGTAFLEEPEPPVRRFRKSAG
ncbi:MAG TPA: diacylglycerol kinase family protein [Chthonomonadaceae bacterium]|nr:diacylglycerol kinase family protein [Chthonomonadaceae bacterium]